MFEDVFISLSFFWRIFSLWNSWLADFSFSTLKLLLYSLLVSIIFNEKICCHPYVSSSLCSVFFSLVSFRILFFLFLVLSNLMVMILQVIFFFGLCAGGSLSFLDLWAYSFQQIWKILAIISSNIFLHLFLSSNLLGSSVTIYWAAWSWYTAQCCSIHFLQSFTPIFYFV